MRTFLRLAEAFKRQELHRFRHAADRGDEARVDHADLLDAALGEAAREIGGDRARFFISRTLADANVGFRDVVAPVLEMIARLAAHGHKRRLRLVLDEACDELEYVARISARKPLVRGADEIERLAFGVRLQQRMAEIAGVRRDVLDHLGHLFRVGAVVRRRILGTAQP